MKKEGILLAFELLLEEFDGLIAQFNEAGGKYFSSGEYEEARLMLKDVESLTDFRVKVQELENEWSSFTLSTPGSEEKQNKEGVSQTSYPSLEQGKKTHSSAFRYPILKALEGMDGRGRMSAVIEIVGEMLKGTLNQYDRQSLPSNEKTIRWENTAAWERYAMVQDGLLKDNSPRGIWELSDAGWNAIEEIEKREKAQQTLYPEE
jgi:restriction system protein